MGKIFNSKTYEIVLHLPSPQFQTQPRGCPSSAGETEGSNLIHHCKKNGTWTLDWNISNWAFHSQTINFLNFLKIK